MLLAVATLTIAYFKLSAQIKGRRAEILDAQANLFRQSEALLFLYSELRPRYGLPETRGWAASPDFLRKVCEVFAAHEPKLVVECSSGVSTLVLAYMVKRAGRGRIVSLEHDATYAAQTRALLRRHGVEHFVEVQVAPLVDLKLTDWSGRWYDVSDLRIDAPIDMLVIDGPPAEMQHQSRYPAYPVLRASMSDNAVILLDDSGREDEREAVRRWCAGDLDLQSTSVADSCEKGCTVLRRNRGAD